MSSSESEEDSVVIAPVEAESVVAGEAGVKSIQAKGKDGIEILELPAGGFECGVCHKFFKSQAGCVYHVRGNVCYKQKMRKETKNYKKGYSTGAGGTGKSPAAEGEAGGKRKRVERTAGSGSDEAEEVSSKTNKENIRRKPSPPPTAPYSTSGPTEPPLPQSWRSALVTTLRPFTSLAASQWRGQDTAALKPQPLFVSVVADGDSGSGQRVEIQLEPLCGVVNTTVTAGAPDLYFNTAAPIVSLDVVEGGGGTCFFLAVGTERMDATGSGCEIVGVQSSGPNLIQIWQVTFQTGKESAATPSPSISFAYGIAHNSGSVLSVAWARETAPVAANPTTPIGLLAVSCTDGSAAVYMCPPPSAIPSGTSHHVLSMKPIFRVSLPPSALITCVGWNPHEPAMLLTGASDGSCQLWHVQVQETGDTSSTTTALPWLTFEDMAKNPADPCVTAVRSVAWCPYDRYVFATARFGDALCLYSVLDPFRPLRPMPVKNLGAIKASTSVSWCPQKSGVWVSQTSVDPQCQLLLAPLWLEGSSDVWEIEKVKEVKPKVVKDKANGEKKKKAPPKKTLPLGEGLESDTTWCVDAGTRDDLSIIAGVTREGWVRVGAHSLSKGFHNRPLLKGEMATVQRTSVETTQGGLKLVVGVGTKFEGVYARSAPPAPVEATLQSIKLRIGGHAGGGVVFVGGAAGLGRCFSVDEALTSLVAASK